DGLERHRLTRLRLDHGVQGRRAASRAVVGAPGLVPGAALALLVEVAALDHRLGDRGAEESDGADGVVVARALVVDQVRAAVRVGHRHPRDAELFGLLAADLPLLGSITKSASGSLRSPLMPPSEERSFSRSWRMPPISFLVSAWTTCASSSISSSFFKRSIECLMVWKFVSMPPSQRVLT